MGSKKDLDDKIYIEISEAINEKILKKLKENRLTVFLIGAGKDKRDSVREKIRLELISSKYRTWFDVYYPEDIFEGLMKGKIGFNLLELENLLANSVHSIVIILESPGSIAELGAFAAHSKLKDKLIVVVKNKYRRKKSFITQGLIKYITRETDSRIIYHNFEDGDFINLSRSIRRAVREISKKTIIDEEITSPILAQYFLLAAIYLAEPVKKEHLFLMVNSLIKKIPEKEVVTKDEVIISSALSLLFLNKDIEIKGKKYCLTKNGLARLRRLIFRAPERSEINNLLDSLRIKIMNETLRNLKKGE